MTSPPSAGRAGGAGRTRCLARSARAMARSSCSDSRPGLMPRKSLVAGGPHWASPDAVIGAQPGSSVQSNRSPSAEVLDEEPVGVTPVVEDLAALDVPSDPPGPLVALLAQVLPAGGQRVQVGDLVGRVHVPVGRAEGHRERVVVGGRRAAVAADEAHHRPPLALPRVVQEVADDQAEVLEIPVQRLQVPVWSAAPRDRAAAPRPAPAAAAGWRSSASAACPTFNVSGACPGSAGVRGCRRPPAPAAPLGSTRSTVTPPMLSGSVATFRPVASASRSDVGRVGRPERRADEPRARTLADQHAGRARVGAPQLQLLRGAQRCVNPNARANSSARSRSGFLNSSQARSCTFTIGLAARPGCSPLQRAPARCAGRCAGRNRSSSIAPSA